MWFIYARQSEVEGESVTEVLFSFWLPLTSVTPIAPFRAQTFPDHFGKKKEHGPLLYVYGIREKKIIHPFAYCLLLFMQQKKMVSRR